MLNYNQIKFICLDLFNEKIMMSPIWHVYKFAKRCDTPSVCDVCNDIIKAKLFPQRLIPLQRDVKECVIKWHKNNSWSNIRSTFIGKFGDPKILVDWKEIIEGFKQKVNETLTNAWGSFRVLIEFAHGLSDWTILHCFYCGLDKKTTTLLDKNEDKLFMKLTVRTAHDILNTLLL
jgi:hypothetical protein